MHVRPVGNSSTNESFFVGVDYQGQRHKCKSPLTEVLQQYSLL